MKLPKSFIPEKDLDSKVKNLLKEPDYSFKNINLLLSTCKEFLEEEVHFSHNEAYFFSLDLVKNISYSKEDIEKLSEEIVSINYTDWLGLHFSALINKIIQNDDIITLNFHKKLTGLGTYMEKGKLIVDGDLKYITGYFMGGGEIHVNGKIENIAQNCEGKIYCKGNLVHPIIIS